VPFNFPLSAAISAAPVAASAVTSVCAFVIAAVILPSSSAVSRLARTPSSAAVAASICGSRSFLAAVIAVSAASTLSAIRSFIAQIRAPAAWAVLLAVSYVRYRFSNVVMLLLTSNVAAAMKAPS